MAVDKERLGREVVAMRVAKELPDGGYVNLGIGIPTLVSSFVPDGSTVFYHSESGILNCGPLADEGNEDIDRLSCYFIDSYIIEKFKDGSCNHEYTEPDTLQLDSFRVHIIQFLEDSTYTVDTTSCTGLCALGYELIEYNTNKKNKVFKIK